jgi:hypothetical protein
MLARSALPKMPAAPTVEAPPAPPVPTANKAPDQAEVRAQYTPSQVNSAASTLLTGGSGVDIRKQQKAGGATLLGG